MSLSTRLLPRGDWDRLAGTELEPAVEMLRSIESDVLVVEDDGAIVGCWALCPVWHVEGVWIREDHRGHCGVARRLWRGMRDALASKGARSALTGAGSEAVARMLTKRGEPLPALYQLWWKE